jgi:hypothetical protein
MPSRPTATWFVTYQAVGRLLGEGYSSKSRQFPNEKEAKAFAKFRLTEGFRMTAGTINPHLPKRFVGSADILRWMDE